VTDGKALWPSCDRDDFTEMAYCGLAAVEFIDRRDFI
jgi:hypothetical protein